jgi:K+-transporting ATPase ATPase A chain
MGEVAFGGLGAGLSSLIMVALMGVFMGGLMIGRSPEYVGKTITVSVAKRIALYALLTPLIVLPLTAIAISVEAGRSAMTVNVGPRAFSEALFAYASCTANNGQSLAGLDANHVFWNLTTIVAMLAGRFGPAALVLDAAGLFAAQGRKAPSLGSLPCDTPMFGVLVLATVFLLSALCFLPALALGPIVESMQR